MNTEAAHELNDRNSQMTVHGVLLEIFDTGVLVLGESGIGKSEIALELVRREHRLVADDAVMVTRQDEKLIGESPELSFEHIEIRGLGIVNMRQLFGSSSVVRNTQIELCIELVEWKQLEDIDRIGLEMQEFSLLGMSVPKVTLPVGPGRNLSTIVETAVRVFNLRKSGFSAAQKLIENHTALVCGSL